MREIFAVMIVIFSVAVFGHHMHAASPRAVPVTYTVDDNAKYETPVAKPNKLAECVNGCAMFAQTAKRAVKCAKQCAHPIAKYETHKRHRHSLNMKHRHSLNMKAHHHKCHVSHHHKCHVLKKFHAHHLTGKSLRC